MKKYYIYDYCHLLFIGLGIIIFLFIFIFLIIGLIEEDYDSIWIHNYFQGFKITHYQERPKIGRQGKFKCYINGEVKELTTDKQNWHWTGL